MQNVLTDRWVRDGLDLYGERLFLAAWEVMTPSWRINDSRRYWTEPSIDFLLLDQQGQLVAVELKRQVPGIRPAWRVLCQVTHRAINLARTVNPERLQQAFAACRSGLHGRVSAGDPAWWEPSWSEFFDGNTQQHAPFTPVRRVVAATQFGPSWKTVRHRFEEMRWDELLHELAGMGEFDESKKAGREARRLCDMGPPNDGELTPEIQWLEVAAS